MAIVRTEIFNEDIVAKAKTKPLLPHPPACLGLRTWAGNFEQLARRNIFLFFFPARFWGFFNKFFFYLFLVVLGLRCCARGLPLVAASGGYSSSPCAGFSLRWLLLLRNTGSRCMGSVVVARGLSSCGSQALERRLSSCGTRA